VNFKTLYILSLSLFLISSCAGTKELKRNTSWSLEFSKGNCLDVCDSYEIKIENSRNYSYKGFHNVKHIGEKSGFISKEKFSELEKLLDSVDWNEYKSQYGSPGTGIQRKEFLFTSKIQSTTITYYRIEPQQIRALELFIDQLIELDDI